MRGGDVMFGILGTEFVVGFAKGCGIGIGIGTLAAPFAVQYLIKKAKTTLFPEKDKDGSRRD
ncbi:hypothetical protein [Bacillus cereus]|uniref:hypothetical protein n=1 Tax=Bacillus cereus TaxID=1396 RepID=UPI001145FB2C|nr:hypothetical protein [Bacillus cereus]